MNAPDDATSIPTAEVERLLQQGTAQPLLEDHFPVPVMLEGRWWHLPSTAGHDGADPEAERFVLAPAEQAALFTALAVRRRTAQDAQRRSSAPGER